MTVTVPDPPAENTTNGRLPHVQVTISPIPLPGEPAPWTTVERAAWISKSRAMSFAWAIAMGDLLGGAAITHGTARVVALTAAAVLHTEFTAVWVVWLATRPTRKRRRDAK